MASVLLISIGPVQDFIASARRCGDLWYGSWLLSELAKAAARGIVHALGDGDEHLEALIFPGISGVSGRANLSPGSDMAVANKILARVPEDSAADVAEAGRAAMAARRDQLASDAFADLGRSDPKRNHHFLEERAWAQVAELVEYTWVAVREPDRSEGYARARQEAERILDARKGTKLWGQPSWADSARKSSLDGIRESALHEDLFDVAQGTPAYAEWLRREYGVRASERLCGVGVLKRAGVRDNADGQRGRARFFSTPHVAALPLMARCSDQRDAFARYARVLREAFGRAADELLHGAQESVHTSRAFGCADGQIFFSDRLAELAQESASPEALKKGLESAKQGLSQFFRDTGTKEPMPYYATLLADGDRMGLAISAATTFKQHRDLSLRLTEFAAAAAKLVKEHEGSLIYAGGDDVLALLPLHTVLACAAALRIDFAERLSTFAIPGGASPTLSVGLGISHYIEPMDAALELARRSERLAKGTRNALAIVLEKRGGSPIEIAGRWEEADGVLPLAARLDAMIAMHRHDEVPDKAAFDLAALGAQLHCCEARLINVEAKRILARKQPGHGRAAQISKEHLTAFETWGLVAPARLANELLLARLFADASDLAHGPVTHAKASHE